jgi:hypothetical protein
LKGLIQYFIYFPGSPPRHLKEQMDRIKKIPSLFDIQTFPPGQSPQKPPMQQGGPMNNSPQQRMQGPNQGQPQRLLLKYCKDVFTLKFT